LEGFVMRRLELAGRRSVELLGRGDFIRTWEVETDAYAQFPAKVTWRALDRVRLAVLDTAFLNWAANHPEVITCLLAGLGREAKTLAFRLALAQQPRLTTRLQLLLWHLADRFGRVHPAGVLLPVPLSHVILADLVSAQRPSVSRAMKMLAREGIAVPSPRGGWFLPGHPPTLAGESPAR
jgi:CRP-like cAMP-binding protein